MTINLIDVSVLKAAAPDRTDALLAPWVDPIKVACVKFEIDRVRRIAAFIGNIAVESGFVPGREENLNYSAGRMSQVWPGRFSDGHGGANMRARELDHNPEAFANVVYANRMGNGPPESGDGWRFRGIGPMQLTGRDNHQRFAKAMGMTLDQAEAYIRTLDGGVMSAAWFWEANDINRLADTPGVADETRKINGGHTGLADRKSRFDRVVARLLALGA